MLDKYDDVNFDAILGTKGVILVYPGMKQKKKGHKFLNQYGFTKCLAFQF